MNYEYLKTFYIVCKYKNFSKAAKAMYTSQPAISRIISAIEAELNVKLFFREKAGVKLTKEGEAFYKTIEQPLNQLERLENELPNVENVFEGIVYMGATVTALSCFLFDLPTRKEKTFLPFNFIINGFLNIGQRIQILYFHFCAKFLLAYWS